FHLPNPFFVMANQNPIETEGVYSLPEAQIDRFLFKLIMDYPDQVSEERVMEENSTFKKFEDYNLKSVISPDKLILMQKLVHEIYLDKKIKSYIVNIVKKTRAKDFEYGDYIELGCSPRASIALYIASKAEALVKGRNFVIPADVRAVAKDVLRHRLILSFKARADKVTSEKIINEILKGIKSP
ncbi:MAG: MoxR family ATPase, partial [archaeon]